MQYKLEQKVKVVVTRELADAIIDIFEDRGYRKPMLLVSTFQLQHPSIQEMVRKLEDTGRSCVLFDGIIPDPPAYTINDGAAMFHENGCDCLIAIGGGSAIDTARGINIVRKFGGKIEDYVSDRDVPEFCEGLIAVPTTSRSSPRTTVRRSPTRSPRMDAGIPPSMPASCTRPSNTPAWTRLILNSACTTVSALASFQMCIAAMTPHTTTTIHVAFPERVRAGAVSG